MSWTTTRTKTQNNSKSSFPVSSHTSNCFFYRRFFRKTLYLRLFKYLIDNIDGFKAFVVEYGEIPEVLYALADRVRVFIVPTLSDTQ